MKMDRQEATVFAVMGLMAMILISALAFFGMKWSAAIANAPPKAEEAKTEQKFVTGTFFFNATHDGHLWVLYRDYNRGGMAHHPDCPCREKP